MHGRAIFLVIIITASCICIWFVPAIPQDPAYHLFADTRPWLGIPNAGDVLSNLPFIVVGLIGIVRLLGTAPPGYLTRLRIAYWLFFIGVVLTGLGSAFYHWKPDNNTLVWDRLPMTVSFMAFFAIIIGEHISETASSRLLFPLVVIGIGSVAYWHWTELQGHGDLRLYALVQFLPLIIIPFVLLTFKSRFDTVRYIWLIVTFYAMAKLFEALDREVFAAITVVSGHTIKHLCAAVGAFCFFLAIRKRHLAESV